MHSRIHMLFYVLIVIAVPAFGQDYSDPNGPVQIDRGIIVQLRAPHLSFIDDRRSGGPEEFDVSNAELKEVIEDFSVEYARSIFFDRVREESNFSRLRNTPDFENTLLLVCNVNSDVEECIGALRSLPCVIYAEGNKIEIVENACPDPVDPYYAKNFSPSSHYQWWFTGARAHDDADINIIPAWGLTCGDASTLIGHIDTGVLQSHEDITPRASGGGGYSTPHGTWTYGIMAANANSVGITGVIQNASVHTWDAKTYSLEAWSDSLMSAVDNWGCDIIGTSASVNPLDYGYDVCVTAKKAADYVFDQGVPFIAAAGNDEKSYVYQPAVFAETIAVGSTDTLGFFEDTDTDGIPDTNHGHNIDILAPGVDMVTTGSTGTSAYYFTPRGTSFAQPLVTGVCGLLHAVDSTLLPEDYMGVLASAAVDLSAAGFDTLSGWGKLDAGRSVTNLVGRYHLLHGDETGGALVDSTYFKSTLYGFDSDGFSEGDVRFVRRYKIETDVTWPSEANFVNADSVFSWGMSEGSTGLRHNVIKGSHYVPLGANDSFILFNRNVSYPDYDSITKTGATFISYYYRIYESGGGFVEVGQSDPDSVKVSYGVIGPFIPELKGYVTSDSTISGTVWVTGDILVEDGVELTIAADSKLLVAEVDAMNLGNDTDKIELIVEGTLSVEGSSGMPVVMRSAGYNQEDDSWVGIVAETTNSVVDIDYLEIKHAEIALYMNIDDFDIRNSSIDSCGIGVYADEAVGKAFNVEASNCADKGFYSIGTSSNFSYAKFDSCRSFDNKYGFVFGAYSDSSRIYNRCVANDNTLDGIQCKSGMTVGPKVESRDNGQNGFRLSYAGNNTVLDGVRAIDNSSGVGCWIENESHPEVKNSYFADNYDNVACKYTSSPNFGQDGTSIGQNNTIKDATRYDFANYTPIGVYAENCYWGPIPQFGLPASIYGGVDILPYLTSSPGFSWRIPNNVLPGVEWVTSNYPNPFNPSTRVDYKVGGLGGEVKIAVYDVAGRLVKELENGYQVGGHHSAIWNGKDQQGNPAAGGIYFVIIDVDGRVNRVNKVSLIK